MKLIKKNKTLLWAVTLIVFSATFFYCQCRNRYVATQIVSVSPSAGVVDLVQNLYPQARASVHDSKFDVVYIKVYGKTKVEAIHLGEEIVEALYQRVYHLNRQRLDRLDGLRQVAFNNLAKESALLSEIEGKLGSNLGNLRSLQTYGTGDSTTYRRYDDRSAELGSLEQRIGDCRELLTTPIDSIPARIFESYPPLKVLNDRWTDAKMQTASLLGINTELNPRVLAARETEIVIFNHLKRELIAAKSNIELELKLAVAHRSRLMALQSTSKKQLQDAASLRVEYTNQENQVNSCHQVLNKIDADIFEFKVRTNFVRISGNVEESKPNDLILLLFGLSGGLAAGVGLIFLLEPK